MQQMSFWRIRSIPRTLQCVPIDDKSNREIEVHVKSLRLFICFRQLVCTFVVLTCLWLQPEAIVLADDNIPRADVDITRSENMQHIVPFGCLEPD